MPIIEPKKLAIAAQGGNSKAYRQLLHHIAHKAEAKLQSKIVDIDARDDVVQEILISVHKSLHTFDPKYSFDGWFSAIIRYRLADYLRRVYRQKDKELKGERLLEGIACQHKPLADNLALALAELPQKQSRVVTLLKLEGQSISQAAQITGMSEAAIKTTAHRAYKKLREILT